MRSPTERFSTRVENYVRYRPHYPDAVLDLLERKCGVSAGSILADVGSGTGISTELLLRSGATVYAVEPNAEMREAAEDRLRDHPCFRSLAATAEATGLPDSSLDLILAGQAFHWFEPEAARKEFVRILQPDGLLVLMWNERLSTGTPFLEGYERLLREFMPEYVLVNHKEISRGDLAGFFRHREMAVASFPNVQSFDLKGLTGRVLSSSYAPEPEDPHHKPMLAELRRLFEACQSDGRVDFRYETQVFYGRL